MYICAGGAERARDGRELENGAVEAEFDRAGGVLSAVFGALGAVRPCVAGRAAGGAGVRKKQARRHGIASVRRERPAYRYMRDPDADGVVCE